MSLIYVNNAPLQVPFVIFVFGLLMMVDTNKHVACLSSYETHTGWVNVKWQESTHCAQQFCHLVDCSVQSDWFWQQTRYAAALSYRLKYTEKNENITYVHVEQTASHNLLWFDLHVLPLVVHIYTLIYITFKVSQQDSSEFIIILNV